ncbi:MAG: hypothetical protein OEV44_10505 [Spirochaetota bacterium]|nr:hypothetical protein [Spirochaetota bacterium]
MNDSLSINEQKQILDKLRDEYKENCKKYGKKIFDFDAFEDRFQYALKKRIDMKNFFLTEITTLEALKNKIESKIKGKENQFIKKIDKMIQLNIKKIAKYPDYIFHDKATYEIKKLLGALNNFLENEFSWLELIIKLDNNISILNNFKSLRAEINLFVGHIGTRFAPRIEDHLLLLNRQFPDYKAIELDEKRFIKDIALFLNKLKDFLVNLNYENKLHNPQTVISKTDIPYAGAKDILGKSFEKILTDIIKKIKQIQSDFRIQEFKLVN